MLMRSMSFRCSFVLVAALTMLVGCASPEPAEPPVLLPPAAEASVPALQEVFGDAFLVGTALNSAQLADADPRGNPIVEHHFNAVTPENVMKWEVIHPEPGVYDFEEADAFVDYAEEHDLFVIGHTLVWHSQTPDWVFQDENGDPLTREALLARMKDHIDTVAGRYRGRVDGWDVVNEALNDEGGLRDSPWRQIIGDDYLEHAFRYAHEADPDAELYYNDYSLENAPRRDGAVRLVQGLLDAGIPVTGIGTQAHVNMEWPTPAQFDSTITAFAALGQVMVTELDITVLPGFDGGQSADVNLRADGTPEMNPYPDGLPEAMQFQLAARYAEIFEVFYRHRDAISRVTFWGVTDGDSWRNGWPIEGRTNYPLLFDREGATKPAFHAVVGLVDAAGTSSDA
ncbi:MAG: endo-1,4-beta-xylanase, partial [Bacteroidota bacterium]